MFPHCSSTQDTTFAIKCSKKKIISKKFYIAYKLTSQNFPSLNILSEVVTWSDKKNGGKCGRFSEEYPTYGRFYKAIQMRLIYHNCRRLTANTGELKCMSLDIMRNFFTLTLLLTKIIFSNPFHCRHKELIIFIIAYLHGPPYSVLHTLFLEVATENHSLK